MGIYNLPVLLGDISKFTADLCAKIDPRNGLRRDLRKYEKPVNDCKKRLEKFERHDAPEPLILHSKRMLEETETELRTARQEAEKIIELLKSFDQEDIPILSYALSPYSTFKNSEFLENGGICKRLELLAETFDQTRCS